MGRLFFRHRPTTVDNPRTFHLRHTRNATPHLPYRLQTWVSSADTVQPWNKAEHWRGPGEGASLGAEDASSAETWVGTVPFLVRTVLEFTSVRSRHHRHLSIPLPRSRSVHIFPTLRLFSVPPKSKAKKGQRT